MAWRTYRFQRDEHFGSGYSMPRYVAGPATIRTGFRSLYEERLAASFDRLDIRYEYEAHSFEYLDAQGATRRYTPDFRLPDLNATFIEVKGIGGAQVVDRVKHHLVLRRHGLTLLLWDANVIDMVERMDDASQVISLFPKTKLTS